MNLIEILLLSMSLSVDTLVVSLGGSVSLGRISPGKVLKVSLAFGLMQAGLIFLGWLAGASVATFIHKAAHIIGFVILLYIGGSMIWSAMRKSEECTDLCGIRNLLLAAFATSIDALATGVVFVPFKEWLVTAVLIIGLVSFLFSFAGTYIGVCFGRRFHFKVELVGGVILVLIGLKILLEHLLGS